MSSFSLGVYDLNSWWFIGVAQLIQGRGQTKTFGAKFSPFLPFPVCKALGRHVQ